MSVVHTVLGEVEAEDLGTTYVHEHLLTLPGKHLTGDSDDLILQDGDAAAAELRLFKLAGGQAMVDLTCPEYGRDGARLAELSRRTGIQVVAATGHIMEGYWGGVLDLGAIGDEDLRAEMLRDLGEGFPEAPDVRAGIIKVGTSLDRVTADEERMLHAASEVQARTGAPISTHTSRGTMPLEQLRIFREAGADLGHCLIGHQDLRLVWEDHLAVVEAGCFIGYDCISKEQYEPDRVRIEFIMRLIEEGYGDRICLSGDLAKRSYLTSYGGGPGFTYILWRFLPWLRQAGVAAADIHRLVVDNPARFLAWKAPLEASGR
jgi:predicted metal-dependent phosphotriesterase family hydrolase